MSVDAQGRIRALKSGTAVVTVRAGNKSAECQVNVLVPVSRIDEYSFSGESTMEVHETHQLQWSISPENASNKNVIFSSSDEKIASVDEKGLVTAHMAGTVRIYIQSEDGKASRTISLTIIGTSGPEYLVGDVNNDARIDLQDVQLALKAALKIIQLETPAKQAADVDQSGRTDLQDARLILRRVLRIIDTFE